VHYPHIIHLTSIADLRAAAPAWDDLWRRSDVAVPLVRAETLAGWLEQFKPRAAFHAIVVADATHWLAALPLVGGRAAGVIPAACFPCNPWTACGDLLCDSTAADVDAVMDALVAATVDLPWPLLWLNETAPEAPRWQAMLRACHRAGVAAHYHQQYRVGRIKIDRDWATFQKHLSKSHRQSMTRSAKRLGHEGNVQFDVCNRFEPREVEAWMHEAFEVENLGWKGHGGTSVIRTKGMFDYFVGQAKQLAAWGQLETVALRLDGQMLAFIYGFRAKRTYFALKIGYDPCFAAFSPGQVIFYRLLERFHGDGETQALDFIGPMMQWQSRWRPDTYGVGRIVMAPRRWLGRAAVSAYVNVWRRFRAWQTAVESVHGQPASSAADSVSPEPAGALG
jgi:CelD/BcsL family acetyltransferase involved in cellulose biosynthesis